MKRNKSGISLIVLIITIIVIVILASAVIVVLKNNGVLTFAQKANEDFESGKEKEQSTLASLWDLIEEKLPGNNNPGEGSGNNSGNTNNGSDQENIEEVLKAKLLAYEGDATIDEDGNIVALSLWNIITYSDGTCATVHVEIEPQEVQTFFMDDSEYESAYRGEITNGEIQGNIPAFVKKSGSIYKLASIGAGTFYNCNTLTTIKIPFTVESIEASAFSGCSSLTQIIVPKMSLISISSVPEGCNPNAIVTDGVNSKTLQEICDEYWDNWWDD